MARKAHSLNTLLEQIKSRWPNRKTGSDGWIGDEAHKNRKSDHNPNSAEVVCAIDVTHDPACGFDAGKLGDVLLASRDPRIKYLIFNKRIAFAQGGQGLPPWAWGPYSRAKTMPHDKHIHISVMGERERYDSEAPWLLTAYSGGLPTAPEVKPQPPSTLLPAVMRDKMAKLIISWEVRRDSSGRIGVYTASDGSKEIAGVNNTYHPEEYRALATLLQRNKQAELEKRVAAYIIDYTKIASAWTNDPGVEFFLRDCVYNRGPTGAARILQRAVEVPIDGKVGSNTLNAMKPHKPEVLLGLLRKAREDYEKVQYKRGPGNPLWQGLLNRWDNAYEEAMKFSKQAGWEPIIVGGGGGAVIGGGGIAAAWAGIDWPSVLMITAGLGMFGAFIWLRLHRFRK